MLSRVQLDKALATHHGVIAGDLVSVIYHSKRHFLVAHKADDGAVQIDITNQTRDFLEEQGGELPDVVDSITADIPAWITPIVFSAN
jgi:hypothetical protein